MWSNATAAFDGEGQVDSLAGPGQGHLLELQKDRGDGCGGTWAAGGAAALP